MRPKTYTIDRPKTSAVVTYFSAGLQASLNVFEVAYEMPAGSYSYPVTIKNNSALDLSTFDAKITGQDIYGQDLVETVDLTTAAGTATTTGLFSSIQRIDTDVTGVADTSGYQPTTDISANVAALELIEDGALDITVDGVLTQIEGLNFDGITDIADASVIIATGLSALAVTVSEASDVITTTSDLTGSSSTILIEAGTGTGTNVVDTGLIVMDTAVDGTDDEILQVGYAVSSSTQKGIACDWHGRNLGLVVVPGTSANYTVQFSYASLVPYETPVWMNIDDTDLVSATAQQTAVMTVPPVMLRVLLNTAGSTDTKLVMNTTDV